MTHRTMDLYREEILDHYKHPRNFGALNKPDVKVKEANASCGDEIEIFLKFQREKRKEKRVIGDITFEGTGCAISMAATSMLTDFVKGKTIEEVKRLSLKDMDSLFGGRVNPGRVKCVTLPLKAIQKGIQTFKG